MGLGENWNKEVGTWKGERQASDTHVEHEQRMEFYKDRVRNKLSEEFQKIIDELPQNDYKTLDEHKDKNLDHTVKSGDTLFPILRDYYKTQFSLDQAQAEKEAYLSLAYVMHETPPAPAAPDKPIGNVDELDIDWKISIRDGYLTIERTDGFKTMDHTPMRPPNMKKVEKTPETTPQGNVVAPKKPEPGKVVEDKPEQGQVVAPAPKEPGKVLAPKKPEPGKVLKRETPSMGNVAVEPEPTKPEAKPVTTPQTPVEPAPVTVPEEAVPEAPIAIPTVPLTVPEPASKPELEVTTQTTTQTSKPAQTSKPPTTPETKEEEATPKEQRDVQSFGLVQNENKKIIGETVRLIESRPTYKRIKINGNIYEKVEDGPPTAPDYKRMFTQAEETRANGAKYKKQSDGTYEKVR